jgi:TonB family protein
MMPGLSPISSAPGAHPPPNVEDMPAGMLLRSREGELGLRRSFLLAVGAHLGLIGLAWLTLLILQFLGLNLLTFDRPEHLRDIEFQLVNAPDEKPLNPHTKNRAEHNTRSGGQKVPNMHEAQSQRQAGMAHPQQKPMAQPTQRPQPARTTPTQQPQQPHRQSKPVPQPQQNQQNVQAPPKPRVTAPKAAASHQRIAALPNPVAPIHVPDNNNGGPVTDTGPVVRGPSGGGSSGGSGTPGPATMPGQFSGGHHGGPSGQGGNSSSSQYGSPGGGGGRPGIDALAEPDFGPYLAELQRRIRRNWTPPEDREDKTVVLLFTIAKDGRLVNITVKRSSGFANADQAARLAVERSAPFRPLPQEYRNHAINVEFTFDYNVFTGRSGGISRN